MNKGKERKQQLRIAMLGHKRVPSREGGIEQVVEELSVRMAKRGHFVTCFNRSGHHVSGVEYNDEKWNTAYQITEQITIKKVFTINRKGIAALTSSFFGALFFFMSPIAFGINVSRPFPNPPFFTAILHPPCV